jgi:hypothetical protein
MKNWLKQRSTPLMFQKLRIIARIFTIVRCLGGILMMCEDILVAVARKRADPKSSSFFCYGIVMVPSWET